MQFSNIILYKYNCPLSYYINTIVILCMLLCYPISSGHVLGIYCHPPAETNAVLLKEIGEYLVMILPYILDLICEIEPA